ncbi:MAG: hypothetical protein KBT04_04245 [Bacteroidales bacterium]|nr:hypothetical protein [Candidatus Colimorpha onthohippi]
MKGITRMANIGLYGSIGITLITLAFYYLCEYRFYINNHSFRWILIAGAVLAVADVSIVLLNIKKQPSRIRQLDNLTGKVESYLSLVQAIYRTTLGVVVAECAIIILIHDTRLLMLIIIMVLMMILCYPNMYKVKVDLALDDDEMKRLYGDKYTA